MILRTREWLDSTLNTYELESLSAYDTGYRRGYKRKNAIPNINMSTAGYVRSHSNAQWMSGFKAGFNRAKEERLKDLLEK